MGYPLVVALRYLSSKKRRMISISTALAVGGVLLGVAALTIVMSVTGGFEEQFRDRILGSNADVMVLKYSFEFREYRTVMRKLEGIPHVTGMEPFVINPMMLTHGDHTASGVLVKGVDPARMPGVLALPRDVIPPGSLAGLRRAGAKPPELVIDPLRMERDAPAPAPSDAAVIRAGKPKDLTPAGGYASRLPQHDWVPEAVDPDPCRSPDAVARMPAIVVGKTLAKQLDVGIGDCVQVTSFQVGLSIGGMHPPIVKEFRVIAVFDAGFDQYDSKWVYVDLYEAQEFYQYGDVATGIEMKLDDIDRADAVAKEIDRRLNSGIYYTETWQQLNRSLFTALLLQQIGMSFVLGLIVLIAACTVIATLIMVVMEKKKEIAVLKAIGARDGAVLRIFLYQGGMIGLVGTVLGVAIGWLCCRFLVAYAFPLDPKVYFISHLPVSMHPVDFVLPALIAVVICLVATILPAVSAARMRPADGLRAE